MQNSIRPGELWLDTNGNEIQAHMPRLLVEDGFYYWYGLDKSRSVPGSEIWHWGVHCYRSQDLYNWADIGLIIPPQLDEPNAPLAVSRQLDRPHIVKNPATGKYVCWFDTCGGKEAVVLIADRFTGPYQVVNKAFFPLGKKFGDFDLCVAESGQGYCYFNNPHTELICADLTDDFCNFKGNFSVHFPHRHPPFTREAPACFMRNGRHYLITSGTTSFYPNPSEVAAAEDWHGAFQVLGDPHRHDPSRTSFHSQISQVFQVPGKKDLYIALADRWLPHAMHVGYDYVGKLFESWFDPDFDQKNAPDIALHKSIPRDVRHARYVWLPLVFENDVPYIDWRDEWRLEEFV